MQPSDLLTALRDPAVFGRPADTAVELLQTHISIVALVGDDVYKFKKAVDLEFLDYTTLDRRRRFCDLEVALNRRLAPDVYLGVVELRRAADGALRLGDRGELVDVAVHMRRLPDTATLAHRLERSDEVDAPLLRRVGATLHGFHREARRGPSVSAFATFAAVAANARQNFAQLAALKIADRLSERLRTRLERATEDALTRHHAAIDRRARADVARDTHGDLRLDHIYRFPGRAPHDLVILDCIEFSEQFRCADPISDLAFLVMDLHRVDRRDLADALLAGYFAAYTTPLGRSDAHEPAESRALLPLYTAYRATVRAKVDAMKAAESEVDADDAAASLASAHRHLLLALRELQPPALRPCLLLVMGLPGTGKSTLARELAADGLVWVRSDAVRKQLAGADLSSGTADIYTREFTARTYAACLQQTRAALLSGERVVVDANFKREDQRIPFLALARDLGVPHVILVCEADAAVVRERLSKRTGDISDADISVYEVAVREWQPVTDDAVHLDTAASSDEVTRAVLEALRSRGLA